MFLDGQKLRPYIPVAETMDFTGAVDNIGLNSHREKIQYPTGKQIEQACARLSDKVKELIRTTYGLFGNESCESLIDLCCNTTPYIESIARNYKYIDKRLFKFDKDLHDKCINMEGND